MSADKGPKLSYTTTLHKVKGVFKKKDGTEFKGGRLSNDLSKINYLKSSSFLETDLISQDKTSSCMSEVASHALYDRLTDKFYGVPNFDRDLHWTNVHLAGSWGNHAYEYSAWDDAERPTVRLTSGNLLKLTDEEEDGVLSDRMIGTCLNYLERAPETEEYALCKCVLSDKGLRDISALRKFHYLQYLDISRNEITTLQALEQMPFLMYLDASNNKLTEVLDFKAPFNLMYANLSSNEIKSIRDISDFWSLTVLDLSRNEIEVISGLQNLRHLRGLNLSYNWISSVEGLSNLNRLKCLDLYNNIISKFEVGPGVGFKTLTRLKKCGLARNRITSLQIVEEARFLQILDISKNKIEHAVELIYLKDLTRLCELDMRDNPVRYNNRYFDTTVTYCKNLFVLDGEEITSEIKVLSRKKFEMSFYDYANLSSQHLLLDSFNMPEVSKSTIPYTDPPSPMIVLVGPPSCLKGLLIDLFCELFPQYVTRGVNHTTRPKSEGEIDGEHYHFVSFDTFKDMMRKGEFYATSECFGHLYGFAESEKEKVFSKQTVLLVHVDLCGALMMKARGLRPTLVLALPKSEEMHRKYLLRKYFCHRLETGIKEVGVSRTRIYECLMRMKKYNHTNIVMMLKDTLSDLLRDASEIKNVKIENPDMNITGGITLRELVEGTCESVPELHTSKNTEQNTTDKNDEQWYLINDKIICFKVLEQRQSLLRNLDMNKIIENSLLNKKELMNDYLNEISGGPETSRGPPSVVMKDTSNFHKLLDDVITSRKTYLEMHWKNPGLFVQVLFTDDMDHALDILISVLKGCVQSSHLRAPTYQMQHRPVDHPLVRKRLDNYRSMMTSKGIVENERRNCT